MTISDATKHGSALILVAFAALPYDLEGQSAAHSMLNGMRNTNQLHEMLNGMTAREANRAQQFSSAPPGQLFRQFDGSYLFGPYRIACPADWVLQVLTGEGSITYMFYSPSHLGSAVFLNQYSVSRFVTINEFASEQLGALQTQSQIKSWQQDPIGPFGTAIQQVITLEDGNIWLTFLSKVLDSAYSFKFVLPANRTAEDVSAIQTIFSTIVPVAR